MPSDDSLDDEFRRVIVYLIRQQLERTLNGGPLHIVVEDENVEDSNLKWCVDNCSKEMSGLDLAVVSLLTELTEDQRTSVIQEAWEKPNE